MAGGDAEGLQLGRERSPAHEPGGDWVMGRARVLHLTSETQANDVQDNFGIPVPARKWRPASEKERVECTPPLRLFVQCSVLSCDDQRIKKPLGLRQGVCPQRVNNQRSFSQTTEFWGSPTRLSPSTEVHHRYKTGNEPAAGTVRDISSKGQTDGIFPRAKRMWKTSTPR